MKTRTGLAAAGLLFLIAACGGSNTATTSGSSCTSGSDDVYVVENASCATGEGKLSRVNPDVPCKEEIVTGLNCPVDFVLSAVDSGIGYLSSRVDGIIQVNVTAKTKTTITCDDCFTNSAEANGGPAGLFLMENVTSAEKTELCAGIVDEDFLATVDTILFIADEGGNEAGSILRWCLVTDDVSAEASPETVISTADIENPRGVTVIDRETIYATGILAQTDENEEDQEVGVLVSRDVGGTETTSILLQDLTTSVKDIQVDDDGNLLIADSGNSAIVRYDTSAMTTETFSGFTDGPRDLVPIGTNSEGTSEYLVSEFDGDLISRTTLVVGSDIETTTTGVTLAGPDGIALSQ